MSVNNNYYSLECKMFNVQEIEALVGSNYIVREVGSNLAIEPKLTRGQTDQDRQKMAEELKVKLANVDARITVTTKVIPTVWVNEKTQNTGATAEMKAENEALKAQMAEMMKMMKTLAEAQGLGYTSSESLGETNVDAKPF